MKQCMQSCAALHQSGTNTIRRLTCIAIQALQNTAAKSAKVDNEAWTRQTAVGQQVVALNRASSGSMRVAIELSRLAMASCRTTCVCGARISGRNAYVNSMKTPPMIESDALVRESLSTRLVSTE